VACVLGAIAAAQACRWALSAVLSGAVTGFSAVLALLYAFQGDWPQAVLGAGLAVMWAWLWWKQRRRRKRRRSLRELGHKMRAVFEAMARNMPRPGPVLRPVPQGAPA
jgi:membrane protein implicated in regulation of membrane protease activity